MFKRSYLASAALFVSLLAGQAVCRAEAVFSSDFGKGDFAKLGWKVEGAWEVMDYKSDTNNPGSIARFPAHQTAGGKLTKTFDEVKSPAKLTLSLDLGWGWGDAGQAADGNEFMLLDAKGNGYVFHVGRAKATWAVQWAKVENGVIPKDKTWAADVIDGAHKAVKDGGGLEHITLTRDAEGNWTLTGKDWNGGAGGSVTFKDATTTSFTQVVLVGGDNFDDQVYNNVSLEAAK